MRKSDLISFRDAALALAQENEGIAPWNKLRCLCDAYFPGEVLLHVMRQGELEAKFMPLKGGGGYRMNAAVAVAPTEFPVPIVKPPSPPKPKPKKRSVPEPKKCVDTRPVVRVPLTEELIDAILADLLAIQMAQQSQAYIAQTVLSAYFKTYRPNVRRDKWRHVCLLAYYISTHEGFGGSTIHVKDAARAHLELRGVQTSLTEAQIADLLTLDRRTKRTRERRDASL